MTLDLASCDRCGGATATITWCPVCKLNLCDGPNCWGPHPARSCVACRKPRGEAVPGIIGNKICCYCHGVMGNIPGKPAGWVSHGICTPCYEEHVQPQLDALHARTAQPAGGLCS